MRIALRLLHVLLGLSGAVQLLQAQTVRPNFFQVGGSAPEVRAVARQGNILYVGGTFNYLGPQTGSAVPVDGTTGNLLPQFPDISYTPPVTGSAIAGTEPVIYRIIPDAAGGWYIGGFFNVVDGEQRLSLIHVTSDYKTDTLFKPNPYVLRNTGNGVVRDPARIYDMKLVGSTLYVGGVFDAIGGQGRKFLAAVDAATGRCLRWNPGVAGDTTDKNQAFTGFRNGAYPGVYALAYRDTVIYAGGWFKQAGGLLAVTLWA
jgi:hypothetical protein